MHSILLKNAVLPGDRIVEPKSNLRLVQHHAIYLGADLRGTDWIIENKIGYGVRLVTANEYFKSVIEVTRFERFSGDGYQRRLAVQRALDQVGQPYSLINFNCEAFANYVQHGHTKSDQVTTGLMFGLFALVLLAIFGGD